MSGEMATRKLFVGQIGPTFSSEQITELFEKFGELEEVHVLRDRTTGESKGAAFVTFVDETDARLATSLHRQYRVPGMRHPIEVKLAAANKAAVAECKVFVGHLPPRVEEKELTELFSMCGPLADVSITRYPNGASKGSAFVSYRFPQHALAAIQQYHEKHVMPEGKRALTVSLAITRNFDISSESASGSTSASMVSALGGGGVAGIGASASFRSAISSSTSTSFTTVSSSSASASTTHHHHHHHNTNSNNHDHPLGCRLASAPDLPFIPVVESQQPPLPSPESPLSPIRIRCRMTSSHSVAATPGDGTHEGSSSSSNTSHHCTRCQCRCQDPVRTENGERSLLDSPAPSSASSSFSRTRGVFSLSTPMPSMDDISTWPPASPAPRQVTGPPGANVYVKGIPYAYTDDDLRCLFDTCGDIISAKIFCDPKTHKSRGYGFVSFVSPESAEKAIRLMNGAPVGAVRLKVTLKCDR